MGGELRGVCGIRTGADVAILRLDYPCGIRMQWVCGIPTGQRNASGHDALAAATRAYAVSRLSAGPGRCGRTETGLLGGVGGGVRVGLRACAGG